MITAVTARTAQESGLVCLTPLRAWLRAAHPSGCSTELRARLPLRRAHSHLHTSLSGGLICLYHNIGLLAVCQGVQRCTKYNPRTTALDSVPYPTHLALWIQPPKQLSPPPPNPLGPEATVTLLPASFLYRLPSADPDCRPRPALCILALILPWSLSSAALRFPYRLKPVSLWGLQATWKFTCWVKDKPGMCLKHQQTITLRKSIFKTLKLFLH